MKRLLRYIINYRSGSVVWWKFWNPQSGFAGGVTGGLLILAIFYFIYFIY